MTSAGSLEGLVVLVTGASSGLGEQLARTLVDSSARPVLAEPSAWKPCAPSWMGPLTR